GMASTFRALLEVFTAAGLPASLYTDRGSHYFFTPEAGGPVDKDRLTQVGRALDRLGIEHIAAYSPEARGRSERMFGTLQDRLPKELALAGITAIEAANRFLGEVYLPAHNARFAKPPQLPESGFVPLSDPASVSEILCSEEERVVARDNTVAWNGLRLQLPASPLRAHYVKARVKVREYPDGTLGLFHGPRRIARYTADGAEIAAVPTPRSLTPCSPPSRRGLQAIEPAARKAATASLDGVCARRPRAAAGRDEETVLRSNKETDQSNG
ncbi:MAG: hypothetical protein ACRETH_11955, partial [Steroidobacteraceae bacterium]